jgi:hypothetical protein
MCFIIATVTRRLLMCSLTFLLQLIFLTWKRCNDRERETSRTLMRLVIARAGHIGSGRSGMSLIDCKTARLVVARRSLDIT